MKKIVVLLLLTIAPLLGQTYSVEIRQEYWSWQTNGQEKEGQLYADLYYGDELQDPDSIEFTYTWSKDQGHEGTWDFYRYGYSDRHGVICGEGYMTGCRTYVTSTCVTPLPKTVA
jgi:hypothetical protein